MQKDSLFDGKLVCYQHKSGYRFSIDSVLLAHFADVRKNEKILDLGTGCGVIGLILCYRHQAKKISLTGIEYQSDLADLALANIAENGFQKQFSVIREDLNRYRTVVKPESFSLVTANPPFYAQGSGRVNKNIEATAARHQGESGLVGFLEAAAFAVKNRGRVVLIYPAESISALISLLQGQRLIPKKIQFIYPYPESDNANLVIVEAMKNGGTSSSVFAPLYIYQFKNGPYTKQVESMFLP